MTGNPTLALIIKPNKSKFDNFKLNETVDIEKLKLLIKSKLLLVDPWNNFENEKDQLTKYLNLFEYDCNTTEIIYSKTFAYGRTYAKGGLSLQAVRKEIRHTISKDLYTDIDVVNAHPNMLYQILKANDFPCKHLEKYVTNRDKILSKIMIEYNTTRDIAKNLFILLLYGGSFTSWSNNNNIQKPEIKFITDFKNEFKIISKLISSNNPKLKELIQKKKDNNNNIDFTVLALFLQEYENKVLEVVYDYCIANGYIVGNNCVLCYDGIMIQTVYYRDSLLVELNEVVKQKTGFDLIFETKSMKLGFTDEEINNAIDLNEYEALKVDFEKYNFKIENPITFGTINKEGKLIIRKEQDFRILYKNLRYKTTNKKGKSIDVSFTEEWLKDKDMRSYDKIDFLPMFPNVPNYIYNSFDGFKASTKELIKTNIKYSCMYKHLKEVVCNNDQTLYNYLEKWLANLLQKPYDRANTAFVLKGIQGTGKDTLFNWFGNNILGNKYYLNEDSIELVFGRFNTSIENKILIVLNETSGKDTFEKNEKLKMSITREKNTIEYKGMTPYETKNNIAYAFLTNNDNPIKVPVDDRRFFCAETNNTFANNNEYFKQLYAEIKSEEYDRAWFEYFMNVDLKNYDFTNNRPITNFYNDLQEINVPVLARFFENIIESSDQDVISYSASSLYNRFNEFVAANKFKIETTITKFGIDIKKYNGIEKQRTKNCMVISININQLKTYLTDKYKIEFNYASNLIQFVEESNE